jgi:hypothetical protein
LGRLWYQTANHPTQRQLLEFLYHPSDISPKPIGELPLPCFVFASLTLSRGIIEVAVVALICLEFILPFFCKAITTGHHRSKGIGPCVCSTSSSVALLPAGDWQRVADTTGRDAAAQQLITVVVITALGTLGARLSD